MDLWSVCRLGPKLACRRRKGTAEGPLSCRSHCRHQLTTAVQEASCSTQWLQGGTGGASMQCTQRSEGAAQLLIKGPLQLHITGAVKHRCTAVSRNPQEILNPG